MILLYIYVYIAKLDRFVLTDSLNSYGNVGSMITFGKVHECELFR